MTWVKLDDGMPGNRKMLRVTVPARYLYVVGLCHCSQGLTNGEIDNGALPLLHAQAGTKRSHVAELVDAGLWLERDGGYEVRDYLDYQPSREKVLAEREAKRLRVQKHRNKTAGNADGNAVTDEPVAEPETPVPSRPVPSVGSNEPTLLPLPASPTPAPRRRDVLFDAMVDVLNIDPTELTGTARGALNKALAELRAVRATPEQIHDRAQNYRLHFADAPLTAPALSKHWAACAEPPKRVAGKATAVDRLRGAQVQRFSSPRATNVIDVTGRL